MDLIFETWDERPLRVYVLRRGSKEMAVSAESLEVAELIAANHRVPFRGPFERITIRKWTDHLCRGRECSGR